MSNNNVGSRKLKNGGYALVTALVFFLTASAAVIAGISDAVFRETRIVRNEYSSKQSYFVAESGAEDIAFRIKTNKTYSPTESYVIGDGSATVLTGPGANSAIDVASEGDVRGTERTVQINLDQGNVITFAYALQGGVGGIDLQGGSTIVGDIYTTASIRGCGTCTITGTAVAAGKSTSNLDQDNSAPVPPPQSIDFGRTNTNQDFAQSFSVSQNLSLTNLEIYIKKTGNPTNATVRITTDDNGKPSNNILASGTLSSSLITTMYGWQNIGLTANPILSSNVIYWIFIDANTSGTNYYTMGANNSYLSGEAKVGRNNTWAQTNLDGYFKIFIGQNQEGISGENISNPLPVTTAYSYEASYVNASAGLYCQIGFDNNKVCDTSRGDPAVVTFPVPISTIDAWKITASQNVHVGDYTVSALGDTLGPLKIDGDLYVNAGGTLQVSGPLWITGSIVLSGGATLTPVTSTESHAVVTDGIINLSGGAYVSGNGSSQILLVSMSTADPALTINGGANDTVVFVPNGGLLVTGGATVNAAAAQHITATGGSTIIYDPAVSKLNITSGSGGSIPFQIKTWKESQ